MTARFTPVESAKIPDGVEVSKRDESTVSTTWMRGRDLGRLRSKIDAVWNDFSAGRRL